uniref:Uncharacterized protein n=1 Tax=Arundo donax TaxID=35708 RepID=A0A0A9B2L1_ARUDO
MSTLSTGAAMAVCVYSLASTSTIW